MTRVQPADRRLVPALLIIALGCIGILLFYLDHADSSLVAPNLSARHEPQAAAPTVIQLDGSGNPQPRQSGTVAAGDWDTPPRVDESQVVASIAVYDSDGRPVNRAKVVLATGSPEREEGGETNAEGIANFAIDLEQIGRACTVRVNCRGFWQFEESPQLQPIYRVTLRRVGLIEVVVCGYGGTPLEGARVRINPINKRVRNSRTDWVTTNASGCVELEVPLQADGVILYCLADEYAAQFVRIENPERYAHEPIVVHLDPGRIVRGTIALTNGLQCENATLSPIEHSFAHYSLARGAFEFRISNSPVSVKLECSLTGPVLIEFDAPNQDNVYEVVIEPAMQLAGKVIVAPRPGEVRSETTHIRSLSLVPTLHARQNRMSDVGQGLGWHARRFHEFMLREVDVDSGGDFTVSAGVGWAEIRACRLVLNDGSRVTIPVEATQLDGFGRLSLQLRETGRIELTVHGGVEALAEVEVRGYEGTETSGFEWRGCIPGGAKKSLRIFEVKRIVATARAAELVSRRDEGAAIAADSVYALAEQGVMKIRLQLDAEGVTKCSVHNRDGEPVIGAFVFITTMKGASFRGWTNAVGSVLVPWEICEIGSRMQVYNGARLLDERDAPDLRGREQLQITDWGT